tara:strand:+ start:1572 stop:1766 length:195 start_codon:yes stop_codon:yes gene_type:complete
LDDKEKVMRILMFAFGMMISLGLGTIGVYLVESATASYFDIGILAFAGAALGIPAGYWMGSSND